MRPTQTQAPSLDEVARWAAEWHDGQLDRDGRPHIEHVRRVASLVAPDERIVAYLHDVLEDCPEASIPELELRGVVTRDRLALVYLTRRPGEHYPDYITRIVGAVGDPGVIARSVKEADLLDNLRRSLPDDSARWRYRRALLMIEQGMIGR